MGRPSDRAPTHAEITAGSRGALGYQHLCNYFFAAFEGLLPNDRIALALLENSGTSLWLAGACTQGRDVYTVPGQRGRISDGTLHAVLATGHPRILNDLAAYVRGRPASSRTRLLVDDGYGASLTAPLCHEGRDLGFLFFNSRTSNTYEIEHAETIGRIADAVASVVAEIAREGNTETAWANVLGSSLSAIARAAREVHDQEVLIARVVDLVNRRTTLAQVLDAVYEGFSTVLPFDRIGFATVDPGGETVSARWARSNGPVQLDAGYAQPLTAGSLRTVIESGTPRIINDLPGYLALHPGSDATRRIVAEGMRASMTYVLGHARHPLGFLFFNSRTPDAYTLSHVVRLRKVTACLTATFERAILFDELRAAHEQVARLLHPCLSRCAA